jgi:hypothetical protein
MSAHESHCDFARYGEHVTHVQSWVGPHFSYIEYMANGMKPYPFGLNSPGNITDYNGDIAQRRAVCTCKVKP